MAASGATQEPSLPGFGAVETTRTCSNVARDRAWFSTYTPFPTFATHYGSGRMKALGVGDVHLPVKLLLNLRGAEAYGTLHLRNVLHAPTSICNIVGGPSTGGYSAMALASETALSGPPIGPALGPSRLEPDTHYLINAVWPDSKRQGWAAARAGDKGAATSPPYTEEEKAWMKREWGGEFELLSVYGLSIYKDEDRDEGRASARAMMKHDD